MDRCGSVSFTEDGVYMEEFLCLLSTEDTCAFLGLLDDCNTNPCANDNCNSPTTPSCYVCDVGPCDDTTTCGSPVQCGVGEVCYSYNGTSSYCDSTSLQHYGCIDPTDMCTNCTLSNVTIPISNTTPTTNCDCDQQEEDQCPVGCSLKITPNSTWSEELITNTLASHALGPGFDSGLARISSSPPNCV
eukprot:sb/3471233/